MSQTSVPNPGHVQYTLLENGLDFIWSALEGLSSNPDRRRLKYAVLHLSSGTELILKERLRREHWSLVFDKPENANRNKYEGGDFTSVSFQACLKRLVEICGVSISDEQKKRVTALRDKRNRLEHFGIVDTVEALTSDAAAALGFVIDFVDSQLSANLNSSEIATLDKIRGKLGTFNVFVKDRLLSLQETIKAAVGRIKTCPSCDQKTMIVSAGGKCLFCHYNRPAEAAANDYIAEILNEVENWPLYTCPVCDVNALVDEGYEFDSEYICFACGKTWLQDQLQFCDSCGLLHDGSKPLCRDCNTSSVLPSGQNG
jgi:hypothetical protein